MLTLPTTPELEKRLEAEAAKRGMGANFRGIGRVLTGVVASSAAEEETDGGESVLKVA